MKWADNYIALLKEGRTVSFRPVGKSMTGRIESGDHCTVAPVTDKDVLKVGDIVLCKVRSNQYLHLIKAIKNHHSTYSQPPCLHYQIVNNHGRVNGWIKRDAIYGKLVSVESS